MLYLFDWFLYFLPYLANGVLLFFISKNSIPILPGWFFCWLYCWLLGSNVQFWANFLVLNLILLYKFVKVCKKAYNSLGTIPALTYDDNPPSVSDFSSSLKRELGIAMIEEWDLLTKAKNLYISLTVGIVALAAIIYIMLTRKISFNFDYKVTPIDLVAFPYKYNDDHLIKEFGQTQNIPQNPEELMLLAYYIMKNKASSLSNKLIIVYLSLLKGLCSPTYGNFLTAMAFDSHERHDSLLYQAITNGFNDNHNSLAYLNQMLHSEDIKDFPISDYDQELIGILQSHASKIRSIFSDIEFELGNFDEKYLPVAYVYLKSKFSSQVDFILAKRMDAFSCYIVGIPKEFSPTDGSEYAYFYWAFKSIASKQSIEFPLQNLSFSCLMVLKQLAFKNESKMALEEITKSMQKSVQNFQSQLFNRDDLTSMYEKNASESLKLDSPLFPGFSVFFFEKFFKEEVKDSRFYENFFENSHCPEFNVAIYSINFYRRIIAFEGRKLGISNAGLFWKMWSLFVYHPSKIKELFSTDLMNTINHSDFESNTQNTLPSNIFFGVLDECMKKSTTDNSRLFLLRAHLLVNNSKLFLNYDGKKIRVVDPDVISFYPLISGGYELMFLDKNYDPSMPTNSGFSMSPGFSKKVQALQLNLNINNSSGASANPLPKPESKTNYSSFWNVMKMYLAVSYYYFQKKWNYPLCEKEFIKAMICFVNSTKLTGFEGLFSSIFDFVNNFFLKFIHKKTDYVPVYNVIKHHPDTDKLYALLGNPDFLKDIDGPRMLMEKIVSHKKTELLPTILPYACSWKDLTLREMLVEGICAIYHKPETTNDQKMSFQYQIFYFFYYFMETGRSNDFPSEFYPLARLLDCSQLVYLHYYNLKLTPCVSIFEQEILKRNEDAVCKAYMLKGV